MSKAIHCSSDYHGGSRLIYRTDAVEERTEWRNVGHTASLASKVIRVICRDCFYEEQHASERRQTSLIAKDGSLW